jgi:hypothetical protein
MFVQQGGDDHQKRKIMRSYFLCDDSMDNSQKVVQAVAVVVCTAYTLMIRATARANLISVTASKRILSMII